MKYLEKAFRLVAKNYFIILPMLVAAAIPALIEGKDVLLPTFVRVFTFFKNPGEIKMMPSVLSMLKTLLASQSIGVLGFLLEFAAVPAAAGMILKALKGYQTGVNDILPSIKDYAKQYLIYWAGSFAVNIMIAVSLLFAGFMAAGVTLLFRGFRVFFLVMLFFLMVILSVAVSVLLSLWFAAMAVDGLNLANAARKSIDLVRKSLLTILLIFLGVNVTAGALQLLIRFMFGWIPVAGSLVIAVIPACASTLMISYFIITYRGLTGRNDPVL